MNNETPKHISKLIDTANYITELMVRNKTNIGTSLNKPPKQRDLITLQRLEASRNIRPTIYQPEWLKECKLTKHLKVEQTAKNQHLKAEMFDNIVKMKQVGSTIQAIGYNKGVPTLLILEI